MAAATRASYATTRSAPPPTPDVCTLNGPLVPPTALSRRGGARSAARSSLGAAAEAATVVLGPAVAEGGGGGAMDARRGSPSLAGCEALRIGSLGASVSGGVRESRPRQSVLPSTSLTLKRPPSIFRS